MTLDLPLEELKDELDKDSDIFETFKNPYGGEHRRVTSESIDLLGLLFLFSGLFLLKKGITFGVFMSLTLFPSFMLYPLVRFILGEKDSVAVVETTTAIEEVLRKEIDSLKHSYFKRNTGLAVFRKYKSPIERKNG
jgi:hypothetical protein